MIIHIMMDEKYTSEFVSFINEKYNDQKIKHNFLVMTRHNKLRYELIDYNNVIFIRQNFKDVLKLAKYTKKADRIIIHGLFNHYLIYLLFFFGVTKKVVWGIWGGDLYDYKNEKGLFKYIKTKSIQNFYGVCTHIKADADFAREVYGFKGLFFPCLMYKSCLVAPCNQNLSNHNNQDSIKILIGNSADAGNRHLDILEKLKILKDSDVELIIPLSYGPQAYADEVEEKFKQVFGEKVRTLRKFMPRDEYYALLSEIDVAIYAHKRQQAVGNITQLLGLGAKIYLESFVTTFGWLTDMGIKVFDYEKLDKSILEPLTMTEKENNNRAICAFASMEALIKQLDTLFLI